MYDIKAHLILSIQDGLNIRQIQLVYQPLHQHPIVTANSIVEYCIVICISGLQIRSSLDEELRQVKVASQTGYVERGLIVLGWTTGLTFGPVKGRRWVEI